MPLTHGQIEITVDILTSKQTHMMNLFEAAVQVKLPPVQVIGVEGEVIVLSAVARVGQNIPATLSEAQEDVPGSEKLLTDDGLQWNTNTWRKFPEESLRELAIQPSARQQFNDVLFVFFLLFLFVVIFLRFRAGRHF